MRIGEYVIETEGRLQALQRLAKRNPDLEILTSEFTLLTTDLSRARKVRVYQERRMDCVVYELCLESTQKVNGQRQTLLCENPMLKQLLTVPMFDDASPDEWVVATMRDICRQNGVQDNVVDKLEKEYRSLFK